MANEFKVKNGIHSSGYIGVNTVPTTAIEINGSTGGVAGRSIKLTNSLTLGANANLINLERTSNSSRALSITGTLQFTDTCTDDTLISSSITGFANNVAKEAYITYVGHTAHYFRIGESSTNLVTIVGSGDILSVAGISAATQLKSTATTGTAPLIVSSTTAVANLNADLLDGYNASDFYLATNPNGYTSNTGTVTSVSGTGSVSGLSLSGTVTTTGNITLSGTLSVLPSNFASQTANTFLAAPNGTAGTPTFRAIVAADIPTLNQNTTGTAANVTGTVAVANGGTGATTLTANSVILGNGTSAVQTVAPGVSGNVLTSNGTTWVSSAPAASGASLIDDTTTNTTQYLGMSRATTGTWSSAYVASTKLYFNPSTGQLNATDFNSLSDARSKDNISTLGNALDTVKSLRGVSFTWKETGHKSIGVIAQEIEKIIPEVVSTNEDGIKSVSYGNIIALLIEAIKEQQTYIEEIKQQLLSK